MRRVAAPVLSLSAALLALLALNVCGSSSSSNGPTTPPVATPTPTPIPTPTPVPPLSASCAKLPNGDPNASCQPESANFMDEVSGAIDTLQAQHPEIFAGDVVLNVGAYYVGVIRNLDQAGLCGMFDGEELNVKQTNAYSDTYDILTARSEVRRKYLGTCTPAVFPTPAAPLPPSPPGCNLAPSREVACGRNPEGVYYNDVADAQAQLLAEKPEIFDFTDTVKGTDWPRIVDSQAYRQGIIDNLVKKGYCAMWDGEEFPIKKTNDFSENYDLNYQDVYVRKGPGTYRGSCYPAGF
jgi:hypothetical protein